MKVPARGQFKGTGISPILAAKADVDIAGRCKSGLNKAVGKKSDVMPLLSSLSRAPSS